MATTSKALELSAELADELKRRLPTMVVTQTFDAGSNPVLTISQDATPAFGEKVLVVRTKPIDWTLATNSIGQAQPVYTPHVMQLCTETDYEGATDTVLNILTPLELGNVLLCIGKRGTGVEWYQSANGTVPSTAEMTAANLKLSYDAEQFWGNLASS